MRKILGRNKKTPLLQAEVENSDTPPTGDEWGNEGYTHSSHQAAKKKKKGLDATKSNPKIIKAFDTEKKSKQSTQKSTTSAVKSTRTTDTLDIDMGNNVEDDNRRSGILPIEQYGLDEEGNGIKEKKKGHKLFFCCCDTKRAVIMLNTVILMLNVFTLTAMIVQVDPATEGYMRALIVRSCGVFITLSTLMGAYWYSKTIVLVGMLFCCYQMTMGTIKLTNFDWSSEDAKLAVIFPVFWNVLIFYAEAAFVFDLSEGYITSQNYKEREEYSCCCGSFC